MYIFNWINRLDQNNSCIVLGFANLEFRFYPFKQGVRFIAKVWYCLILYSFMYETCPRASVGNISIPSSAAYILNMFSFGLILWTVTKHLRWAFENGKVYFITYLAWICLVLFQLGIAYIIPSIHLHLHHYHWGWLLAHYAIFPTDLSESIQAMFIGFFLHGCTVFGVQPVFLPIT